jgi:uncharacterized membrane protein YhaH (DUF805 family)
MHLKSPSDAAARFAIAVCATVLLLHEHYDHDIGSLTWWLVTWPLLAGMGAGLWVTTAVGVRRWRDLRDGG